MRRHPSVSPFFHTPLTEMSNRPGCFVSICPVGECGDNTYVAFTPAIRRILYTTNPIERLHRQFRKVTKTTTIFPTDTSLMKLLWLAQRDITKKWSMPLHNGGEIIGQLSILFPDKIIWDLYTFPPYPFTQMFLHSQEIHRNQTLV